ncbi:hypothetical protein CH296_00435 [Rhodococcus sp. 14-2496-1d]|uniref:hypothetical protein n=1 Tax=Rhodococcus sp. 14-2496-1d TaxID=2023146 RepID=UPI000B9B0C1E|nr:hypothetical protein [Rhodococcus sp. 14-2496-1d]OZF40758.1 hypothetical protein CH296_00435 [Rhodococcus sp. 14-2496-1d]
MDAYKKLVVLRRVMINLKSGTAISGVVTASRGPLLEVKDATVHTPGSEPAAVDGSIVIEKEHIDFTQLF